MLYLLVRDVMADVSTDVAEFLFCTPPLSPVCAPSVELNLDFDILEFPFEELPPAAEAPGYVWSVDDVVLDDELCHGVLTEIEQLIADMPRGSCQRPRSGSRQSPARKRQHFHDEVIESLGSVELPRARRGRKVSHSSRRQRKKASDVLASDPVDRPSSDDEFLAAPKPKPTRKLTKRAHGFIPTPTELVSDAQDDAHTNTDVTVKRHARKRHAKAATATDDVDTSASRPAKRARKAEWSTFLDTLTSQPDWQPLPDRRYVLTDEDLDVLCFYGSNRNTRGHNVTPDYVLSLLGISSWEDQELLNQYFDVKQFERIHPVDDSLTAGHVRFVAEEFDDHDPAELAPNLELMPRTYCVGSKKQCPRSDLHRFSPQDSARVGRQLCPVNGLCAACLQMTLPDLIARYKAVCAAVRDEVTGNVRPKAELPRYLCTQYDCNVRALQKLKAAGKTYEKITPGYTRPHVSLDIWKPTPLASFAEVVIPEEDASTPPVLKFGRYGARNTFPADNEQVEQQQIIQELPPPGRGKPRWLTLAEVKQLHGFYQMPMKPIPYGRKYQPTPIRDHSKSLMCRRQFYIKSKRRMAKAKRRRDADKIKTVSVKLVEPEAVIQLVNRGETFVIPVSDGKFRLAERAESGRVRRHRVENVVTGPPASCASPPPGFILDRQVQALEMGEEELPYTPVCQCSDAVCTTVIEQLARVTIEASPAEQMNDVVADSEDDTAAVVAAIVLPPISATVSVSSPASTANRRRQLASNRAVQESPTAVETLATTDVQTDQEFHTSLATQCAASDWGDNGTQVVSDDDSVTCDEVNSGPAGTTVIQWSDHASSSLRCDDNDACTTSSAAVSSDDWNNSSDLSESDIAVKRQLFGSSEQSDDDAAAPACDDGWVSTTITAKDDCIVTRSVVSDVDSRRASSSSDEPRLVIVTSSDDEVHSSARMRRAKLTRRITDAHASSIVSELASLDSRGSIARTGNQALCNFVLEPDELNASQDSAFSDLPDINATDAVQQALQTLTSDTGGVTTPSAGSVSDQPAAESAAGAAVINQNGVTAPTEADLPPQLVTPTDIHSVHLPDIICHPLPDLHVGSGGRVAACPVEAETEDEAAADIVLQLQPVNVHQRSLRSARENEDAALLEALCDDVSRDTGANEQRTRARVHLEDIVQTSERRTRSGEILRTTLAMRRAEMLSRRTRVLSTGEIEQVDESHVRMRFVAVNERLPALPQATCSDVTTQETTPASPAASLLPRVLMDVNALPAVICDAGNINNSLSVGVTPVSPPPILWVPGPRPVVTLERGVSNFRQLQVHFNAQDSSLMLNLLRNEVRGVNTLVASAATRVHYYYENDGARLQLPRWAQPTAKEIIDDTDKAVDIAVDVDFQEFCPEEANTSSSVSWQVNQTPAPERVTSSSVQSLAELAAQVCARSEYIGRQIPSLKRQLAEAIEIQSAERDQAPTELNRDDVNDATMSLDYVMRAVQAVRAPAEASTRGVLRELFLRRRQLETRQAVPAFEVFQLDAWVESIPDAQLGQMIFDARVQLERAENTVVLHINAHDDLTSPPHLEPFHSDDAESLPGEAEGLSLFSPPRPRSPTPPRVITAAGRALAAAEHVQALP